MNAGCRSIQKELEALRPFADRVSSGDFPLYSEKEVLEAEKRLGTPLPAPVRELYRGMADLLLEKMLLTPLELVHWEGDYLGFYESPDDGVALGIKRGGGPDQLYRWELSDPEEESFDYPDEFTGLCEEGDQMGRQKLARRCHAYWKKINARYPNLPEQPVKLEYETRYNWATDAYGLFLALYVLDEAYQDFQREHPDQALLFRWDMDFSDEAEVQENGERRVPDRCFARLHDQITRVFAPLSPGLLALEGPGLQMAYLHREGKALLLAFDWDTALTLLLPGGAAPGLLEGIEGDTGLNFKPCKL